MVIHKQHTWNNRFYNGYPPQKIHNLNYRFNNSYPQRTVNFRFYNGYPQRTYRYFSLSTIKVPWHYRNPQSTYRDLTGLQVLSQLPKNPKVSSDAFWEAFSTKNVPWTCIFNIKRTVNIRLYNALSEKNVVKFTIYSLWITKVQGAFFVIDNAFVMDNA